MKKYRITTTHTVLASSQEEALAKLAKITASTAVTAAKPKAIKKVADELADQMIEVAAKYAKKWGRTSGVGFVTIYGTSTQGITVMDKAQLVKYLEKQKANLIDIIENDGVASSGVLKGRLLTLLTVTLKMSCLTSSSATWLASALQLPLLARTVKRFFLKCSTSSCTSRVVTLALCLRKKVVSLLKSLLSLVSLRLTSSLLSSKVSLVGKRCSRF